MKTELTAEEIKFLLVSLEYTKMNFENTAYPTYELRREQIEKVEKVTEKLRTMIKEL